MARYQLVGISEPWRPRRGLRIWPDLGPDLRSGPQIWTSDLDPRSGADLQIWTWTNHPDLRSEHQMCHFKSVTFLPFFGPIFGALFWPVFGPLRKEDYLRVLLHFM